MWAFVSLLTVSSGVSTVCHQRVPVHGGAAVGAHTQIYVQHQGQLLNQNYYWHEWQETRLLKAVERMPSAPSSILNASPPLYEVSRAVSHSSVWYYPCSSFCLICFEPLVLACIWHSCTDAEAVGLGGLVPVSCDDCTRERAGDAECPQLSDSLLYAEPSVCALPGTLAVSTLSIDVFFALLKINQCFRNAR